MATPNRRQGPTWSDEQVSKLAWVSMALRHRTAPESRAFWEAFGLYGMTKHLIEKRNLIRVTNSAFRREYPRGTPSSKTA